MAARPQVCRPVLAGVLAVSLTDWVTRRPELDPVRWAAAYALDDPSYCAGLWAGALRWRTMAPLLPAVPELVALRGVRRRGRGTAVARRPHPARAPHD
ncbi:MAG: hypothetical protein ACOYBU_07845 [Dermatophilaceae bacterium]